MIVQASSVCISLDHLRTLSKIWFSHNYLKTDFGYLKILSEIIDFNIYCEKCTAVSEMAKKSFLTLICGMVELKGYKHIRKYKNHIYMFRRKKKTNQTLHEALLDNR